MATEPVKPVARDRICFHCFYSVQAYFILCQLLLASTGGNFFLRQTTRLSFVSRARL